MAQFLVLRGGFAAAGGSVLGLELWRLLSKTVAPTADRSRRARFVEATIGEIVASLSHGIDGTVRQLSDTDDDVRRNAILPTRVPK
ncbi:hypothetical protein [Mycobacterium paraintracellulare]|uniref:hypothetical protein n=1 Tax=Mycobacterium paraintracellulare TaxID=1138383 RepID=UPI001927B65D|nr:hypothetical protein [Mycobacterium paraintracellulare]BCP05407.1 hypothetical protein MINTM019_28630 [Mycobacterium paraintracellulare]